VSRCSIQWSTSAIHLFKVPWRWNFGDEDAWFLREEDEPQQEQKRRQLQGGRRLPLIIHQGPTEVLTGYGRFLVMMEARSPTGGGFLECCCFGVTRCRRWLQSRVPLIWAVQCRREGSGMRRRGHGAVTEGGSSLVWGRFPRQLSDTWLTSLSVLIIIISWGGRKWYNGGAHMCYILAHILATKWIIIIIRSVALLHFGCSSKIPSGGHFQQLLALFYPCKGHFIHNPRLYIHEHVGYVT
jgi:hypothetical protein